jgi:SAM-dependent methyltransferase
MKLTKDIWNERYHNKEMGWDIGHISSPLKEYFDQLENKNLKILIPGCGNAYEAEYIRQLGFKNVFLIDWAQKALDDFEKRNPGFPKEQLICGDFFKHQDEYNLIIEQTFFCAIKPDLREDYIIQMKKLLAENGKLVGLLFNDKLFSNRPPFGGKKSDYEKLFSKHFNQVSMEIAYNSIPSRQGRELFISVGK